MTTVIITYTVQYLCSDSCHLPLYHSNHFSSSSIMEMENYTSALHIDNFSTAVTENEQTFSDSLLQRINIQIINITIYSIISILGTVGNGLVIWIIGFKMEKTATLIWFLNLGIADFMFCLLLFLHIIQIVHPHYWPFGWIMCKTWNFNLLLNLCASVLFLMIISVDRCICVLYPMLAKIHRTSRLASIISVITWIISMVISSPNIAFQHYIVHDDQHSSCFLSYIRWDNASTFDIETSKRRHRAMIMTRFVSMFLIPFSIILVCYGLIALQVRKSTRIAGSGRTLKILFTIVICFFSCWFLFHIRSMIDYADIYLRYPSRVILDNLSICLAFFNSCLNPIIYVFIGRDFKKSLRKSIPFLLENTFREGKELPEILRERNDPPETPNQNMLRATGHGVRIVMHSIDRPPSLRSSSGARKNNELATMV
ncbi:N-formyl peptide receptor 2-like [Xenopus laevis]|uniref:N-formyl peptide receptor 2-like n=1 Tax=Xenopus laevis TaxID=8355 RepID=A0A8J1L7U2_XENLA|nr:N-formyl peptide receptor 2-like [Xenopus laevis]XP_041425628.1 N-formyl peptide receptor 2-like [Xenopus laevis]